jgi:hypothetical protein
VPFETPPLRSREPLEDPYGGTRRLCAAGQVGVARTFQARPRSILVGLIPKRSITGHNIASTNACNATMQVRFGAARAKLSQICQAVTNTTLAGRIVTRIVGAF